MRIRSMFNLIAPSYDFLNHLLSLNVDRYWRWRTTRLVPPAGDAPILDLCSGTGGLARGAGAATPRRVHADGRVRYVEADAQHLPFPDHSFQIAAVAFGLRNVTDT